MKITNLMSTVGFLISGAMACTQGPGAGSAPESGIFKLEGVVNGGGGKGVLCGNSLRTLDLYEAQLSGLPTPVSSGQLNEDLKIFGIEMAVHFAESPTELDDPKYREMVLEEMNKTIVSKFRDIPLGQRLPLTSDATPPQLGSNCQIVQIATYTQNQTIFRDKQYWDMLAPVEQAALIIHEWIYHRARQYGSLNSDETRKVLGMIFSGRNPEPLVGPIWNAKQTLWCGAGIEGTTQEIFEFYVIDEIQNGKLGVGVYFRAFKSVYLTSRTSTFIPKMNLDQFRKREFSVVSASVFNKIQNKNWVLELQPDTLKDYYALRGLAQTETAPPYSRGFCRYKTN
jgi:hypothetical protein